MWNGVRCQIGECRGEGVSVSVCVFVCVMKGCKEGRELPGGGCNKGRV